MKRKFLFILTLFVTLGACQKESSMHENIEESNTLLARSKKYYASQLRVRPSNDTNDINVKLHQPDWSKVVYSKTEKGYDLLSVPLKSEGGEHIELNIAQKEDNVYGLIKRYAKGKMYFYSGSGRLQGSGVYDSKQRSFKLDRTPAFSTMDFDGGELDEVEIPGGGGNDGDIGWTPDPVNPDPTNPNPDPGDSDPTPGGGGIGSIIYVVDPTIKQKYPKFADLVQQIPLFLSANPKVMDALVQFTGFTKAQIQDIIIDGQGPKLTLSSDPRFNVANGLFNGIQDANTILISESNVQTWENKPVTASFAERSGLAFSIMVTILHETVHYGRFHNGLPDPATNPDYGTDFEELGFGFNVEYQTNQPVRYTLYMLNP